MLRNNVGIIDCGFTSTVKIKMFSLTTNPNQYEVGDRCAQMMIIPRPQVEFELVDELTSTERNNDGFGSTGT